MTDAERLALLGRIVAAFDREMATHGGTRPLEDVAELIDLIETARNA